MLFCELGGYFWMPRIHEYQFLEIQVLLNDKRMVTPFPPLDGDQGEGQSSKSINDLTLIQLSL